MGTKGEETREKILQQAASLFNEKGYSGASLSDILRVTGLQKGGIYNHFESKEQLAVEAFDYAISQVSHRFTQALIGRKNAIDRLLAIVSVFNNYQAAPPISGGCPIMNTAIESDNANPVLRVRARHAMDTFRGSVRDIVSFGVARGEVRAGTDPEEVSTVMIALFEGGLMLSMLYQDPVHLNRVSDYMMRYIENSLRV